jgi:serine protease Do
MRSWYLSLWLPLVFLSWLHFPAALEASEARETPLVRAVGRAKTSVVNIHSERTARDRDSMFDSPSGPNRKVNGMGTGIVVDERGYIVTNQHVIADVDLLRVTLHDGSTYTADVISYDRKHDLAIIKIESSRPLAVMPLGTSSDLRLGETVVAVGNAFGYEHTVTAGIISALSRDVEVNETQSYRNLLQTDASINPGNSGGPLLNLDGEVVGINVAIRAGAQRIGFAIPIDDARRYIAKLLNISRLNGTQHGLITHDVKTPAQRKLVVDSTDSNSPAATAGFLPGDVVTHVAAQTVVDQADLERAFLSHQAGVPVEITVERANAPVKLTIKLARVAAEHSAQPVARSQSPAARPTIRAASEETVATRAWRILGLRLDRVPAERFEGLRHKYRGGMRVVDVRPDSPASRHGIRKGDILVGLHTWETVKAEDIGYVLNQTKIVSGTEPLKFYVVRGQEVLYGNLRLAQLQK